MLRVFILILGISAYLTFNGVFLYLAAFLLEAPVPITINGGPAGPLFEAVTVNLGTIFLFGFLHSLMAREGFKRNWTRIIPAAAERSLYVLQASACLMLIVWAWRPMPATIWEFQAVAAYPFYGLFGIGVVIVLWSTFLIDHFELFGLRQIWSNFRGRAMPQPEFRVPALYRIVRHPMQTGVLMIFWATPHMTAGHALLAVSMTIYVMIGLYFEERSLMHQFGEEYANYRARVPMLLPRPNAQAKSCVGKLKLYTADQPEA